MAEPTVSYLIGRADRLVRAQLDDVLLETELSVAEMTALSVLETRPSLSNAQLARRSLVTPQAMHKVIRSLEERGLIRRTAAPNGGRTLETVLTKAGAQKLRALRPRLRDAEDRALVALGPDDRAELLRLLTLVSSSTRS